MSRASALLVPSWYPPHKYRSVTYHYLHWCGYGQGRKNNLQHRALAKRTSEGIRARFGNDMSIPATGAHVLLAGVAVNNRAAHFQAVCAY